MVDFTRPRCNTCGGNLLPTKDEGVLECESCMNLYPLSQKKEIDDELIQQLNSADNLRKLRHFDDAGEMYEDIITQYPDEVLAYWGAFLSEYGVEYVQQDNQYMPICHRVSRIRATDSRYLTALCAHCKSESDRQVYRMKAQQVENIRYRTYELSRSQQPYDVFVCHSGGTREAHCAKRLCSALEEQGKRVFVSQFSGDPATQEAYVYSAVQSAEYMFVIAENISSLESSQNTWSRFIALPDKKLQVLHDGLNESDFPYKLRRIVQTQAPIDLGTDDWLDTALRFIAPKKEQEQVSAAVAVEQDNARLEEIFRRVENLETGAKDLAEAFIMTLTYITLGDVYNAEKVINVQLDRFNPGEIRPVAELAVEFLKLTKSGEAERKNCIAKIGSLANRIRSYYPKLTETERSLYVRIKRGNLLIYLAKCFGAIKDTARQCFILDLVDYAGLDDFRLINEFAAMLFTNGRLQDVREVMRALPRLDGDYLLPLFLKNFSLGAQKQTLLMAIADKFVCTEKVADELNAYLSTCDDVGVALAVVQIMTRCSLSVSVVGLDGALSKLRTGEQVKTLLENFGKRALSGIEVDKLVIIAANGDDAANEVLRHLRYQAEIGDLGVHNMRLLISKCHLSKIQTALFSFKMDHALAEQLLLDAVRGNGEDRLAVVSILLGYVSAVDLEKYGTFLLGNDPIKVELAAVIAPKAGKFAGANKIFEQFLRGNDYDSTKRKIISLFDGFPFNDTVTELYLGILPSAYDDEYKKLLFGYIAEHPTEARSLFVKHYEKLIDGYEEVLPKMLSTIKFMDENAVVRFMLDFHGSQSCKDALFMRMLDFLEKPKKLEVDAGGVTCNLLQAYIFTLRGVAPTTNGVVEALKKKGLKLDDKVVAWGKKHKPSEYVGMSEIKPEVRTEVEKYFK